MTTLPSSTAIHFGPKNLPFAIVSTSTPPRAPQVATRLHDTVIFISALHTAGALSGVEIAPSVYNSVCSSSLHLYLRRSSRRGPSRQATPSYFYPCTHSR